MHHTEALAHQLTLRLHASALARRGRALRLLETAPHMLNDRRRDVIAVGKYLSRSKHISEIISASRCSPERARALAQRTSSSVGLNEASSCAVASRRNRGYPVRSMTPLPRDHRTSGPRIRAQQVLQADLQVALGQLALNRSAPELVSERKDPREHQPQLDQTACATATPKTRASRPSASRSSATQSSSGTPSTSRPSWTSCAPKGNSSPPPTSSGSPRSSTPISAPTAATSSTPSPSPVSSGPYANRRPPDAPTSRQSARTASDA